MILLKCALAAEVYADVVEIGGQGAYAIENERGCIR